ncbi:MAG: hypothetical protein IKN20_07990 [Firmicutes bacterium]|nr:hypothetical protein [Bacillota bacterium]
MNKGLMCGIIALIALALVFVASNISAAANPAYLVAAVVLMGAYCFGQYRLDKNYR